jgi:hypothetical protein
MDFPRVGGQRYGKRQVAIEPANTKLNRRSDPRPTPQQRRLPVRMAADHRHPHLLKQDSPLCHVVPTSDREGISRLSAYVC